MKYRLLGNSGLRVSELSLGTMTFGEEWGWGTAKDEAQKVYATYREAGGNFIDTANVYTNGTSEKFLGQFVKGHPDGQRCLRCWVVTVRRLDLYLGQREIAERQT